MSICHGIRSVSVLMKRSLLLFSFRILRSSSPPLPLWILIIITIIAFKGAIRDFLQSPHSARTVTNTHAQVAQAQSCANHVQHIDHLSHARVMLRATWYEGTAQLLSLTQLKSHLFELYFVG